MMNFSRNKSQYYQDDYTPYASKKQIAIACQRIILGKNVLLHKQSKKLSTADDYRRYNLEVARLFGEMCSIMKGMTGKLPPIMREYCDFIFSVGEKTELMAKLVSDYTQVILKGIDKTESEWRKVFSGRTTNAASGSQAVKLGSDHSLESILDLFK